MVAALQAEAPAYQIDESQAHEAHSSGVIEVTPENVAALRALVKPEYASMPDLDDAMVKRFYRATGGNLALVRLMSSALHLSLPLAGALLASSRLFSLCSLLCLQLCEARASRQLERVGSCLYAARA